MTDDENVLIQLRRNYEKDEMVAYVVRRIKELKVELGQANSEIDHLNEENKILKRDKNLNDELTKEARKEVKKEELYLKIKQENEALNKKIQVLIKDKNDLIIKLNQKMNKD